MRDHPSGVALPSTSPARSAATWRAPTSEPGATVEVVNSTLTGAGFGEVVAADEAGRFTATLLAARGNTITVTAEDAGSNVSPPRTVVAP